MQANVKRFEIERIRITGTFKEVWSTIHARRRVGWKLVSTNPLVGNKRIGAVMERPLASRLN